MSDYKRKIWPPSFINGRLNSSISNISHLLWSVLGEKKILQQNFKIFGMNNRSGSPLLAEENTFGRFQFVWEAPGIALTSVLILAIAALVGTSGNLLILVSVCHTIKGKSLFVGNLAVSDLFVTLIVDPINILGKYMYRVILFS